MKMATFNGYLVDFDDLENCPVVFNDIAQALSNMCRFSGQCSTFYSVAQHSVRVALELPGELRLAGLLHDATEAYLVDIPRPLKRHFPKYQRMESILQERIFTVFGLTTTQADWKVIKQADDAVLCQEWKELMPQSIEIQVEPAFEAKPWKPLSPNESYDLFYWCYNNILRDRL